MSAEITESELRERVRTLLSEIHPDDPSVDSITFRGAQYDHGLAWVHFPEGLGGLGLSRADQAIVADELGSNAKNITNDLAVNAIGIGMGAPTVLTYGTPDMHERFLRPIFTGEEIWCQMFSEPGAGSDVAGLSSRAVRDGDDWIINGQKVWTSLAHHSTYGMLLVRTDPSLPKHDGMSYFVLDMKAPGVDVRPLHQITGEAEFNEVFFNDVRIPHSMMLGHEGQGWRVAITTLMNERVALAGNSSRRGQGDIAKLVETWQTRRHDYGSSASEVAQRALAQDKVLQTYIEAEMLRITHERAKASMTQGVPGPEGSVGKLMSAELNKKIYEVAMDLLGNDALTYEPGYELRRPGDHAMEGDSTLKHAFLRMRAQSIEGGTSEIMRNILAERVLGLPGDVRNDKDVPWVEIPRSG
ncbi:MAG: acyl-CoA dehydrogenase [Geminicoccus sp.]|nr:acyl-CoA dehydrogenase [Geminicoccus sp.]